MKLKLILAAGMLMSVFATSDARADDWCSLTVNQSTYSYIWRGQSFSYEININQQVWPGPMPPGGNPGPPFTIVFHDTNTPPSSEYYPGTFGYGYSVLTGYQNPSSGGFSGTYYRWAEVYDNKPGHIYCRTNVVTVVLQ